MQLFVGELHVFAFGNLKSAHQLVTLDDYLANRTDVLIVNARAALLVQLVKSTSSVVYRRVKADGDRH